MRIRRGADTSLMEPKVLSVLRVLIHHPGQVVTRDAIIQNVWGSPYGGEERLSRAISLLRKALGDVRGQYHCIETVPRSGYRLIATIEPLVIGDAKREESRPFSLSRYTLYACVATLCAGLAWWVLSFSDPSEILAANNSAATNENSVAVLPFTDLSAEGNQQYFSDGLAEEILDALAKVEGLSVAGRTSSFALREQKEDITQVGKALRVSFLLQGAVRKQKDTVRVTTRLLRVADGYQAWSKTFDGDLSDIFEFQESIARAIAAQLSPTTSPTTRLARELTPDRQAYELFLQGREMSRRFGRASKLAAIDLLREAVARDPQFADAWAWLARSHLFLPITDPAGSDETHISTARHAVAQALAHNDNLAMGHYVSALLHDYDLNFDASFEAIERAYTAAPKQPFFAIRRGFYHLALGYVSAGAAMIESGLRMDPTDAVGLLNLGYAKIHLGDIEEGLALVARSEDLGFAPAGLIRCIYLGNLNRRDNANACWRALPNTVRGRYPAAIAEETAWADLGRFFADSDQAALERIRPIVLRIATDGITPLSSYLFGVLRALGEFDAYTRLFTERPFLLNASVIRFMWLDLGDNQVYRDVRFPAFAERLGFTRVWALHGWPDYCRPSPNKQQTSFYCD